jgi:hypothetical protein
LKGGSLQFTLVWDDVDHDLELSIWAPDSGLYQSPNAGAVVKELTPASDSGSKQHWKPIAEEELLHWESIDEDGLYIRNFVFLESAVAGKYKFSITTNSGKAATRLEGTAGWQLWIHENGREVFQQNGASSASSFFGYEYNP